VQLANFYTAFFQEDLYEFRLARKNYKVERAKFGLHLVLAELADKFDEALKREEYSDVVLAIDEYFSQYTIKLPKCFSYQKLRIYLNLRQMNSLKFHLPFMEVEEKNVENYPYSYQGRIWTQWVHLLCKTYHWTIDYLLELWPEQVISLIQEIIISEYYELEQKRMLSEVSYNYDEKTKKSRYIALPKPGWMISEIERKIVIPGMLRPAGQIIDLSKVKIQ